MACSDMYLTVTEYTEWACMDPASDRMEYSIENLLTLSAARINAARHASDQCDCTLASWAEHYLKELNAIIAVVSYNCPCHHPAITEDRLPAMAQQVMEDLVAIRQGKIELCQGETGSEYPDFGIAEVGWTGWAAADIIANANLREDT